MPIYTPVTFFNHTHLCNSEKLSTTGEQMNNTSRSNWLSQTNIAIACLLVFITVNGCYFPTTAHSSEVPTARLAIQLGHRDKINSSVVSADGRLLLTASDDGTARLWETATGYELRRFEGHRDKVNSAVFSPDGNSVLTGSDDGTARLWEAGTGRETQKFEDKGQVTLAVFATDGSTVLTVRRADRFAAFEGALKGSQIGATSRSDDFEGLDIDLNLVQGTTQLLDRTTGHELRHFKFISHTQTPSPVVLSPDRRSILILNYDGTAQLWKLDAELEPRRFGKSTNQNSSSSQSAPTSAVFSLNGKTLLIVSHDCARLWDIENTGRERQCFGERKGKSASTMGAIITSAVFSSDEKTVLTSDWEMVFPRQTNTPSPLRPLSERLSEMFDEQQANKPYYKINMRLWNVGSGNEVRRFGWQSDRVTSSMVSSAGLKAIFSPDDSNILTISIDGLRLWKTANGNELWRSTAHTNLIASAAFVAGGLNVLTASLDRTARLWDTASGRELLRFEGPTGGDKASAMSDGQGHAVDPMVASLLNKMTGGRLNQLALQNGGVTSANFSSDDGAVLTASNDGTAHLWEISSGHVLQRFARQGGGVNSAVFSPDGRKVLTASLDGAYLWDTLTGREIGLPIAKQGGGFTSAVFSPDGQTILTASWDKTARLWNTDSRRELMRFVGHENWLSSAVFSADGKTILTASWDQTARLWDTKSGHERLQLKGHSDLVASAVFSADGTTILTASWDQTARLWDTATGHEIRRLEGHSGKVTSAVFSADGKTVLTASFDKTARLWDTMSGRELWRSSGQGGGLNSARFSPNGLFIMTASVDGTTHIWDLKDHEELVRLVSLDAKTWVVTTPDGRFDTNNLEEIKGLHWIMPDDPMRSLPIEIFMRDYYQPRLLPMLLGGVKLSELPSVGTLNRAQPKINVDQIRIEDEKNGLVAITIEVTGGKLDIKREGKQVTEESGVYDLRLFRDGQLVAQFPEPAEAGNSAEQTRAEELTEWRRYHEIKLDLGTRKKTVTFHGIRLPRNAGLKKVEFSAYAFNVDRVKSATARTIFEFPNTLTPRQARAYIITIGVNGFENKTRKRLAFAVNDANILSTEIGNRLQTVMDPNTGKLIFGDANVVPITLVTNFGTGNQKDKLVINHATKDRIKAVIEKLAGKRVNEARLAGLANIDRIQPAHPEDLVLLAFSTHGNADRHGQFYLMPYDLGTSTEEREVHKNAISSEELSMWLRTLDAGQIVMIVDACHSVSAVENNDFKPGPMGSRGLGQLAFDKGMRILAASQRDDSAFEIEQAKHGLLSYALVQEGLKDGKADFKPKDTRIQLSEWLSYGVERTPNLYLDHKGKLKAHTTMGTVRPEERDFTPLQQPTLFDFSRGRDTFLEIINH